MIIISIKLSIKISKAGNQEELPKKPSQKSENKAQLTSNPSTHPTGIE